MNSRLAHLVNALLRTYNLSFLGRAQNHIRGLPPSDKIITYFLAFLIVFFSILSFLSLEETLLVEVPAHGGVLTEGSIGSPRYIHPLLAISDPDRDLVSLTYAGLMGVAPDGTLEPVLAESYTMSPDGKVYTFTLRPGIKFSDGSSVTTDDVVFTIEKAQDPALKSPKSADWNGVVAETIDARTVQFTLSKPYAPFLENMTLGILPAHLWRSITDEQFPFSNLTIEPVGAGPFRVAHVTRDKAGLITGYTLSAFSGYALGRPYLDGITFKFFSKKEDLVSALEHGSVESVYGVPSDGALTAPYARVFGVFFNPNVKAVFARLEVRKALSFAIDRNAIVSDVLGGYATPLMGPIPPKSSIDETPVPDFTDPIREASNVLLEAGWKYDGDVRMWKHAAAKLSLDAIDIKTSNVPELKAVASKIKSDWEKLGVPVEIELYEPGDLNQNVIRSRKYEALLFGMVIGRNEDLYAFWDSAERNDPGLNIALYANKNIDALLEETRQTSDSVKRQANLQKIENEIAADFPAAFTHAPDFIYKVPENLHGILLPQIVTPSDRFSSVRSWYLRTEKVWPFFAKSD